MIVPLSFPCELYISVKSDVQLGAANTDPKSARHSANCFISLLESCKMILFEIMQTDIKEWRRNSRQGMPHESPVLHLLVDRMLEVFIWVMEEMQPSFESFQLS